MVINNDLIIKFEELIQEAKKVDWNGLVAEPTFMDIAGYPHYENVCSNILAFFIQTDAVHNLKDLLLKAILKAIKIDQQQDYSTNEVAREVMTDSRNRIDLVIVTDDMVVAIENKIYASLCNDLVDYSTYLDRKYPHQTRYKVVLSLHPVNQKNLSSGFVNVTYPDLFNEID